MTSSNGGKAPSEEVKESSLKSFLAKLRKLHIIETLATFIAGGWLLPYCKRCMMRDIEEGVDADAGARLKSKVGHKHANAEIATKDAWWIITILD
jgi:hypothetical protein